MEPGRETARDWRQKEPVGRRAEPEEVISSRRKRRIAERRDIIPGRKWSSGRSLAALSTSSTPRWDTRSL